MTQDSAPLPVQITVSPGLANLSAALIASRRSKILEIGNCLPAEASAKAEKLEIPDSISDRIWLGSSSYGSSSVKITSSQNSAAIFPNSGRFHLSRPPPAAPNTQISRRADSCSLKNVYTFLRESGVCA